VTLGTYDQGGIFVEVSKSPSLDPPRGLTLAVGILSSPVAAQEGPAVLDPNLRVRTVVGRAHDTEHDGFLGPNDFLIAEKNTGQVKRVVNGVVQSTVLDLAVNNASERGLLGMAPLTAGGYLFHFNLTGNRREIAVDDPRLDDRVADNNAKHDITESESLLFGTGFGVSTDIETGPNGNLFVVSLSAGAVYEIFRR
jgi:hypothetical protein